MRIEISGVRDSMGCYFAGECYQDGELIAVVSADDGQTCWEMAREAYSTAMLSRAASQGASAKETQ